MDTAAEKLREGIFNLNTRRFGTVCELIIQKLAKYGRSRNQFHDLYDEEKEHRVEVKFSRVQKKNSTGLTIDSLIEAIVSEIDENRTVLFDEWKAAKFDCNIQQVKLDEFEFLYYGLFFWDNLALFKISSDEIASDEALQFSHKQHKGNIGEGQFHIHEKNLQYHLDTYGYKVLSYDELIDLLRI